MSRFRRTQPPPNARQPRAWPYDHDDGVALHDAGTRAAGISQRPRGAAVAPADVDPPCTPAGQQGAGPETLRPAQDTPTAPKGQRPPPAAAPNCVTEEERARR